MATWPATIQLMSDRYEVALLQSCLIEIAGAGLGVDGKFGNATKTAVAAFQTVNGLTADGIVGPMTWSKVFSTTVRYIIKFTTGESPANDPATTEDDSLYESSATIQLIDSGGVQSALTLRGSIFPNDMNVKGRLKNGWYLLKLGFHNREGTPTADDMIVKTGNVALRPALIVNEDADVPVMSNDQNKTTSNAIHIHNGFLNERGSDGCPTIRPSEWSDFISPFLTRYTNLSDWHQNGAYRGRDVGVLVVE